MKNTTDDRHLYAEQAKFDKEITKPKTKKRVTTLDKIVEKMFDVKQEEQSQ